MRERVGAQQLRPWVGARRAVTPGDLDAEERLIEPDIVEVYPVRARDALAIRFPTDYVPLSSPPFFLESRLSPDDFESSEAREAPPARVPIVPARSCSSEGTTKSLLAGPFAISGRVLR
jgi:hypothetical protein